ncbi:hypothetical protein F5051DRAFT_449118 [Lentinula edodes]|nr:hypothetical protein F5051DRAFT_449118 [Lentinula edodes]
MTGVLFANYDFNSSSSLSSPSRSRPHQEKRPLHSPGPSTNNTPSKGTSSLKSIFGSPSTNELTSPSPSRSEPIFATPSKAWVPPFPGSPSFSRPQRPLDKSNLGYLAFPTAVSPLAATSNLTSEASDNSHILQSSHSSPSAEETNAPPPPPVDPLEEKHRARLEREEVERVRGEKDWVRSGGILRDSEGKRDFARTEKVREEIRLREWEKEVQERWDGYERRWAELQAKERKGDSKYSFQDIPWPVHVGERDAKTKSRISGTWGTVTLTAKVELPDLNRENVEKFLTDGLKVRGCKVTRKERVRTSLLRWHPDKMTALVSKVIDDDRKDVESGISAVVRCLQDMNSKP